MMKKCIVLLFFLIINQTISYAQTITGTVFDKTTNETLEGASVYFDGTTIGTITDIHGNYKIDISRSSNAPLVISFIGYKTKVFQPNSIKDNFKIYLDENPDELNEIFLEADIWSRAKKMQFFKSEFLGNTASARYCRIVNQKDISLRYNSSTNTLLAFSDQPIIVVNKYLGYKITYNLIDFEIEFANSSQQNPYPFKVYYVGTSFFSELNKKIKKKHIANREKAYLGSIIHFMRSLSNKKLDKNNFDIYYKSMLVPPYKYFNIIKEGNLTKVEILTDRLIVLYNNTTQSSMDFPENNKDFTIDENGNHSISSHQLFGGDFGMKRISEMLPLNYNINVLED